MNIDRVDPFELDDRAGEQLATAINAANKADGFDGPDVLGSGLLGEFRYGGRDRPVDALWLARDEQGVAIGCAEFETSEFDNPEMAFVFCDVHPAHRGRGIGTAFLEAQLAEAREHGRTSLMTFQGRESSHRRFLESNGFTVGMKTAQRRLDLRSLDYGRIEGLLAGAREAAADYEVIHLDGPAPAEWLPDLVAVHEAINDAPMDEISMEAERFPVERLLAWQRAQERRHQHIYRILVRHRETHAWAGHTILVVDEDRPGVANQEDTSVVVAHRGHRLGMLLKTEMLMWMREVQPGLTTIDTWNAESNTHMIAVNDEIGTRVSNLGVGMQLSWQGSS
jgi:GNAT superfamily N-acetyltransferase